MESESLGERYLTWLYSQVASVKTRARVRRHWCLVRQLHETIFVAIVPHDENRCADAKDLRYEYLAEHEGEQGAPEWMGAPCSMLELLLVLSRALAFETDDEPKIWFWHLIDILELRQFNDHVYDAHVADTVEAVLERVIWRQYTPDGYGGLFPLRSPERDQRKVELWYQLNAYLLEHF